MTKTLVAIVDDNSEVTAALRWLIESVDYQVVTYACAESFLTALPLQQPSCLILDIRMPVMSGLELYEILKTRKITIPIIFITAHGDIAMAVHAIQEGAANFLTKPINNQLLLEAVNKAIRQNALYKIQEENAAQIYNRTKGLTPRECEVMSLMVKGELNKSIANQLGICKSTAELHRANVMRKMQVNSFAELVTLVIKYDLIAYIQVNL